MSSPCSAFCGRECQDGAREVEEEDTGCPGHVLHFVMFSRLLLVFGGESCRLVAPTPPAM